MLHAKFNSELCMINDFQQMADTWGQQGLGIVIGEWGITDHWTTEDSKARIHENMSYYCKILVSEARQRNFSTFIWDNNVFGNGEEKFGIFDRHNDMALTADWIVKGIQQGVATGIKSLTADRQERQTARPSKYIHQGKLYIKKDGQRYNFAGMRFEN